MEDESNIAFIHFYKLTISFTLESGGSTSAFVKIDYALDRI